MHSINNLRFIIHISSASQQLTCDSCSKKYSLKSALLNHKLNTHKLLEKRTKTSVLIQQNYETDDIIYSSDSDCEYRIKTVIERIPKIKIETALIAEDTNPVKPYEIIIVQENIKSELNDVDADPKSKSSPAIAINKPKISSNQTKPKLKFECIYCKKLYSNRKFLQNHINVLHIVKVSDLKIISDYHETPKKTYHCKHCDKMFQKRIVYEQHIANLRKDKPFFCKTCQTGFDNKSDITRHKRTNIACKNTPKLKTYLCNYCGKYFERKHSFDIHTKIHTNEKPFICVICKRGFIMKSTLKEHMNSHSGDKPYICPVAGCEKQFGFASGLRQHRMNMHEPPTIKCTFCDKMFAKKVHMEYVAYFFFLVFLLLKH